MKVTTPMVFEFLGSLDPDDQTEFGNAVNAWSVWLGEQVWPGRDLVAQVIEVEQIDEAHHVVVMADLVPESGQLIPAGPDGQIVARRVWCDGVFPECVQRVYRWSEAQR